MNRRLEIDEKNERHGGFEPGTASAPAGKGKGYEKRTAGALLLSLAIVLVVLAGGVVMFQDRQIYFPENPSRKEIVNAAHENGLRPWPSEHDYRGLVREPSEAARATLVLFHGNAGHAGQRAVYAEILSRFGVRVILAEYPAYGSRKGKLGEEALVADALQTFERARQAFPGPIMLAGESLGAGVAAAIARPADVSELLLITPWDRIENVAKHHFPWLPVGLFLQDRYDNVDNLDGYEGRVAVIVAERDSIVPASLGKELMARLSGSKRLFVIPSADHNDWMARIDADWWETVMGFLLEDIGRVSAVAASGAPGAVSVLQREQASWQDEDQSRNADDRHAEHRPGIGKVAEDGPAERRRPDQLNV